MTRISRRLVLGTALVLLISPPDIFAGRGGGRAAVEAVTEVAAEAVTAAVVEAVTEVEAEAVSGGGGYGGGLTEVAAEAVTAAVVELTEVAAEAVTAAATEAAGWGAAPRRSASHASSRASRVNPATAPSTVARTNLIRGVPPPARATPTVTRASRSPLVPPPARAMPTVTRASRSPLVPPPPRGLRQPQPESIAPRRCRRRRRRLCQQSGLESPWGCGGRRRRRLRKPVPPRHGQRHLERQRLWRLGATGYGAGYGTGVGAWGTGSPMYGWGYSGYSNPYSAGYAGAGGGAQSVAPQQAAAAPYNYSQPISTTAAPPEQAVASQSASALDQARDAFKAGDYGKASQLDQQALAQAPNDTSLHEFLGLVYFAQGKYDQAAEPLYAVLSVGPGWDWTTVSGMYPDVETYTRQLRALEASVRANPNSAPARFVLAYQYLVQGHDQNAVDQLKAAVRLQPGDTLSAQLIAHLQPTGAAQPASAEAAPSRSAGRSHEAGGKLDGHAGQGRQGHPGDQGRRQIQLGCLERRQAVNHDRRQLNLR